MRYPRIYDLNLRRTGELRTAEITDLKLKDTPLSCVTVTVPTKDIGSFGYRQFVEIFDAAGKRIDLFRVTEIPKGVYGRAGTKKLKCDQVLCTLSDDITPTYMQIGGNGQPLASCIRQVLACQQTARWKLGRCDFATLYEYSFASEGLLSALLKLIEPIPDALITTDTTGYPWTLNVVRADDTDATELRYSRNMEEISEEVLGTDFATRLYPLGYGEGVNQLNIKSVNGGTAYIDSPTQALWGVVSKPYVDTTITDAATLLAQGRAALELCCNPHVSYGVTCKDISILTGEKMDAFYAGRMARIVYHDYGLTIRARVREVHYPKPITEPWNAKLTIANRSADVASVIAQLQRTSRIEQLYGQGSTTFYSGGIEQNADAETPAEGDIYLPETMVHVNAVMLKVTLSAFRADSKGAAAGGRTTTTTQSGGGSTQTSSSGGAYTSTSEAGGAWAETVAKRIVDVNAATTSARSFTLGDNTMTQTGENTAGLSTLTNAVDISMKENAESETGENTAGYTGTNAVDISVGGAGGGTTGDSGELSTNTNSVNISVNSGGGGTTGGSGELSTNTNSITISVNNGGGGTSGGASGDTGEASASISVDSGGGSNTGWTTSTMGTNTITISTGGPSSSTFSGHKHSLSQKAHKHTMNQHRHSTPDHSHSLSQTAHKHSIGSHTHSTPDHTHGLTQTAHKHSIGSHTHSTPNHTHGLTQTAHKHSIGSHAHSMPDHTHSLTQTAHKHSIGGHTHSIPAHTHSLVQTPHKHSIPAHTHDMNHYHSVVATVTIPGQTISVPDHFHKVQIPAQRVRCAGNGRYCALSERGRQREDSPGDIPHAGSQTHSDGREPERALPYPGELERAGVHFLPDRRAVLRRRTKKDECDRIPSRRRALQNAGKRDGQAAGRDGPACQL